MDPDTLLPLAYSIKVFLLILSTAEVTFTSLSYSFFVFQKTIQVTEWHLISLLFRCRSGWKS